MRADGAEEFTYTDDQWRAVESVIGPDKATARSALEAISGQFLSGPTAAEMRADAASETSIARKAVEAADALRRILEEAGLDYNVGGLSLQSALEELVAELEHYIEFNVAEAPRGREDRGRAWYLHSLVDFWFCRLGRTERVTIVDGAVVETPFIRFMLAASRPVLSGHHLTAEMARHAYRDWAAQSAKSPDAIVSIDPAGDRRAADRKDAAAADFEDALPDATDKGETRR